MNVESNTGLFLFVPTFLKDWLPQKLKWGGKRKIFFLILPFTLKMDEKELLL